MIRDIKLNLGSGPSGLNTWLNFDYGVLPLVSQTPLVRRMLTVLGLLPKDYDLKWPKIKLVDINKRLPLANSSVKYIYCSHVLEHFESWEVKKILTECYRVLGNGGVMRIVVPDPEKICRQYLKDLSGVKFCRRIWGYDKDIEPKGIWQKLSRKFIRDHKWLYDKKDIVLLLRSSGFERVRIYRYRDGEVPDIGELDLPQYRDHSSYIETRK